MITIHDLSYAYHPLRNRGDQFNALTDINATIRLGSITGVLGPNASGKTTLLRLLTGELTRFTQGHIDYEGRTTTIDDRLINSMYIASEGAVTINSIASLHDLFRLRETWDENLYQQLMKRFELPLKGRGRSLSTGKRAALCAVLGLASGAAITVFDETQNGMDVAHRRAFYEEIIACNAETGRTFILSTHVVAELEQVLEGVVILDRGRVMMNGSVDELRQHFSLIQGPTGAVEQALSQLPHPVCTKNVVGNITNATVEGPIPDLASGFDGVSISPVGFEDAFLALTSQLPGHALSSSIGFERE